MTDIVHLLPDSIANQIAAGEVVQRPASVVKELVENAIDAGATQIQLRIIDAGRTLLQVIDNGKGMSPTDARMAFERHATSKIKAAEDLFALTTMGFRGEALPSIAAVSQVELRTKAKGEEVGTILQLEGSKVISQEMDACPEGCNFSVKNLFFNIPARRKFLKSNDVERRNILQELERIVLVYPQIEFSFVENDIEAFMYPASSLKQRIINVCGKNISQQLLSLEVETTVAKITGFVGKPEAARKTRAQQFFFINGRYMRNAYFNSAILSAYQQLIGSDEKPNYFIYMQVDPSTIDVNIHPTKTEVKFENEQLIWQILSAATKEALGKFNEIPTIDFDQEDAIDIPIHNPDASFTPPKVSVDPSYNPFRATSGSGSYSGGGHAGNAGKRPTFDWEQFYDNFKDEKKTIAEDDSDDLIVNPSPSNRVQSNLDFTPSHNTQTDSPNLMFATESRDPILNYQYKNRYIITSVKSGLMLIDQHRAHIRILYEEFMMQISNRQGVSQRILFPEIIELSTTEASFIPFVVDDLEVIGFQLSNLGGNSYAINGVPGELAHSNAVELLHEVLHQGTTQSVANAKENIHHIISLSLAQTAAIPYNKKLSTDEMNDILSQLFAIEQNKYTPDGKTIIHLLSDDTIDKLFR